MVTDPLGMHARFCALLVKTLAVFQCEISVHSGSVTVNAKTIFGLMGLAVACGDKMTFTFRGAEATAALSAIERLFETQFRDDEDQSELNETVR